MYKFEEIVGSKLMKVSVSSATYVGMDNNSEPNKIEGCCIEFDLGNFIIENPYQVKSPSGEEIRVSDLTGDSVVEAYSTETEIKVIFSSGSTITVSLLPEHFVGPEAASFEPKEGNIVVFN